MIRLYRFIFFSFICFVNIISQAQEKALDRNDITYTYIEALRHKVFGNLPQAAYLFKKISEVDSTCASCFYELSGIFYSGGDVKNGLPFAEKAYQLDKENYWYARNYADYLRYNDDWPKSVSIYKDLLSYKESTIEDTFFYAEGLLNIGRSKEGLEIIDKVERNNGISEQFILLKYRYFLNAKNYNQALSELNKLKQLNPDNMVYYGMEAEIFALQKKNKEALESYGKLLKADPYYSNAYSSLGKFFLGINDTSKAYMQFNLILNDTNFSKNDRLTLLNSFLKENDPKDYYGYFIKNYMPQFIAKHDTILEYQEFLCDFYEVRDNFNAALEICESLLSKKNANPVYWDRYFYYLNILKKYDEILSKEKDVYQKLSDRPFVLFVSGLAAYFKDKPEKSIQFLKHGLDKSQNNKFLSKQMLNLIAENYYKIKKTDSAFYYYDLAISEGDEDIALFNNYAYYMALEGKRLDYALKLSKITIEKEPKNATYLDTYAWILFNLKLYDQAYKYIKLAYKYDKRGSAEMVEHVGDILFCLGKKKKAQIYWKKAAALANNDPRILNKIKNYVCP